MNSPRLLVLSIVLFTLAGFARAQLQTPPPIEWERAYGGSGNDGLSCVAPTSDGGYVFGGGSLSPNSGDIIDHDPTAGVFEVWVLKTDASGRVLWSHTYKAGNALCGARSIAQTSDGGFIVGGITEQGPAGFHQSPDYDSKDCFVMKLDPTGGLEWMRCYGGTQTDELYSLCETPDHGFAFCGFTQSSDGDVHAHSSGTTPDAWVVKLSSDGSIVWEKSFGAGGAEYFYSIQPVRSGGYIVAGNIEDLQPKECWILRLDENGGLRWPRRLGGTLYDATFAIRETRTGRFLFTGYAVSGDGDVTGHSTDSVNDDVWTGCLDSSGTLLWERCLGGGGFDIGINLRPTSDGGCLIVGLTASTDGDVSGNHSAGRRDTNSGYFYNDIWVAKLDAYGTLLWEQCYGGTHDEDVRDICLTSDGGCLVVGASRSTDGDVTGNHGGIDGWVFKLPPTAPVIRSVTSDSISLLCQRRATDTVWVRNAGMKPLALSSASLKSAAAFLLTPAPLPDTLQPGDSLPFAVTFNPAGGGTFLDTLLIANNDTITGHNPWKIAFSGRLDTLAYAIQGVRNDTLDFGTVECGQVKDSSFGFTNRSTRYTSFDCFAVGGRFLTAANIDEDPGVTQTVAIRLLNIPGPGTFVAPVKIRDTCGRTDTAFYARAHVDSARLEAAIGADTTVCLGDSVVRTITVRNRGRSGQTVVLRADTSVDALFSFQSDTVSLAAGDSVQLQVVFHANATGVHLFTLSVGNRCSAVTTLALRVTVSNGAVLQSKPIPDTTVCPNTGVVRGVTLRNTSSAPQHLRFTGDNPLFTITPDSCTLAGGDSVALVVTFTGSPAPQSARVTFLSGGCALAAPVTMRVDVRGTNLVLPAFIDTTLCVSGALQVPLAIRNADTVEHVLRLSATSAALSRQIDTLAPLAIDTVVLTVSPVNAIFIDTLRMTDECGLIHAVPITIHSLPVPPRGLMLIAESVSVAVGDETRVYLISDAPVAALDTLTLTLVSESTALRLDSVTSAFGAPSVASRGDTSVVTLAGVAVPAPTDTIATFHYRTLIGATLTPWVSIPYLFSTSPCAPASTVAQATITLLPPGCELGTVRQTGLVTAIDAVYPNPARGSITIMFTTAEDRSVRLELRDPLGRTRQSVESAYAVHGRHTAQMSTEGCAEGVYFVFVRCGSVTRTRTISVIAP